MYPPKYYYRIFLDKKQYLQVFIWDWYVMDDFKFKTDLGVEEGDFSHKVKNSYLPLLLIIMVIIIVTVSE